MKKWVCGQICANEGGGEGGRGAKKEMGEVLVGHEPIPYVSLGGWWVGW